MSLFNLPFLRCFTPAHFHNTPCWKNALPFFRQSLIRESFSRFLLRYNFSPFLNECQLFISKDFETSLLTLFGVSLVLWRRKADNEHSNPLFYGPSPLNSQHLHFQFTVASLLKIFVRSRRDWEKKCREGFRHSPSSNRYGFAKQLHSFCALLHCHAHPWEKRSGGGEICREGGGN